MKRDVTLFSFLHLLIVPSAWRLFYLDNDQKYTHLSYFWVSNHNLLSISDLCRLSRWWASVTNWQSIHTASPINKNIPNYFKNKFIRFFTKDRILFLLYNQHRLIGLEGRVFANGPGDLGSIQGGVIPKTLKMVFDTSLLNTQQYKVRTKGKVEQLRKRSCALPYALV